MTFLGIQEEKKGITEDFRGIVFQPYLFWMRTIFDNIAIGWNQINILLDKTKARNPMGNKECQKSLKYL